MSPSTILVTGGTGFIGGHVVDQLLKNGSIVKAVVRPGREPALRSLFPDTSKEQLQAVEVSLLGDGDYSEALKGVDAIVHVAIPNPDKGAAAKDVLKGIYNGTLHIVNSAIKAGIKKIVVSSTVATLIDEHGRPSNLTNDQKIGPDSWGPWKGVNECEGLDAGEMYAPAKTLAERGLFEIASTHRYEGVDITSIVMPFVFGPYLPTFPKPDSADSLSIHALIYALVGGGPRGSNTWPSVPKGLAWMIDSRDAAKAHILALDSPSTSYDKRVIVCAKKFSWPEFVEIIRAKRPELAHRLPNLDLPPPKASPYDLDTKLAEELLGLKEYIPIEETVLASLDVGLHLEK